MPTIIRLYTRETDASGRGACVGFYAGITPHKFGRDEIWFTTNPEKAVHFETMADALEEYRRPHPFLPVRADGKPHRPLGAWSPEMIEHVPGQGVWPVFGSTVLQLA